MKRMKGFDQSGKRQINMKSMANIRDKRGTRANTAAAAIKAGKGIFVLIFLSV